MKASWEKIDKHQGVLTVETDEQAVDDALNQAFRKVVKKVTVPGFRKGRVPRHIFERRFGVEALYQDALEILLPKAYEEAVKITGIEPVDRPEVDIEQMEKGKSLIFKAKVTVKPEVELGEYKGLEIPKKDFSVKAEDVEEELKRMQKQQGHLEPVEEGEVQEGDRVVIDFEGFIDGEPFEDGKGENYSLEVGKGYFIPGFEEQLVGMKPGEEKEIQVTFPEDYRAEKLAGKDAVFRVKLHEIKRLRLPELDDEFAQDVSEFDTLDELKADLENKLKERAAKEEENYKREKVVELAAENAKVDIPEVMIEHEAEHLLHHTKQNLSLQGLSFDLYLKITGQTEEKIKEELRKEAEKKVLQNLVLEAISKKENIEVSDEEVEEEIKKMAEDMQREPEEVREIIQKQGNMESIREQLLLKKTVDLLVLNIKNTA